jgi:ketosteroid isomerase-like protein
MSQPDTATQQFIELETQWMNAWKTKDEPAMRKILAEDFTLTSSLSSGEVVTKEMWIDKALHQYSCDSFSIDKLTARVYGRTAVLNISFHQKATANGKDWSGDFLITDVWVQHETGWQVVSRHASWMQKK